MLKVKHVLKPAEKLLILFANEYFKSEAQRRLDPWKRRARQRVAECLRFAQSTISAVITAWNKNNDLTFGESEDLDAWEPDENYEASVRTFIHDCNLRMEPCTSKKVQKHLQDSTGMEVSRRTVRRWLKKLRFRFIKGESRSHYAESTAVAILRAEYLARKQTNTNARGNPRLPEVYLDESYVNQHHTSEKTWLGPNEQRVNQSGRGPRMVIIGAGVILMKNNRLHGEWVRDSLQLWQADRKKDHEDYHGNFDAPTFERWFTKLCVSLSEDYGPCRIHMDRASYHTRCVNPAPTTGWLKADISYWLWENCVYHELKMTKKELLEMVALHRQPKIFAAVKIAEENGGHEILYTPPYHPELQPIELIWGMVKNRIAADPAVSMSQLKIRLIDEFRDVTSTNWTKAYKHAQAFVANYAAAVDTADDAERSTNDCLSDSDLTECDDTDVAVDGAELLDGEGDGGDNDHQEEWREVWTL